MATHHLEATVRHQPGLAIIDLRGDIDIFAEKGLNAAYSEAERDNPFAILLNFTEVRYINSTGLALIVGLMAQGRQAQRRLLSCGLSAHYVKIFQITRLTDVMTIFPDETSALNGLKSEMKD
jgi:anti-anti-sigma factor